MRELPKQLVINDIVYILQEDYCEDSDIGEAYFVSYYPPEDSTEKLPPEVHNRHEWMYLVGMGLPRFYDEPRTLKEQAYDDMWERLEGAREFYPTIDEAINNLEILS